MGKIKPRLCQHLRSVGLSAKESARFANLVNKWVDKSGPEWAVSRLKDLAAAYHDYLADGTYEVPVGWATRVNRRGKVIFKDGLIHRMLTASGEKSMVKSVAFFRSYQIIMLGKESAKQLTKFKDNLERPQTAKEEEFTNWLAEYLPVSELHLPKTVRSLPMSQWDRSKKSSPVPSGGIMKVHHRTDDEVWDIRKQLLSSRVLSDLWEYNTEEVSKCLVGNNRFPNTCTRREYDGPPLVGTINFIQEPGCKLRTVANPMFALQALGEPLKQKLAGIMSKIPQVFVTDQDAGRGVISDYLRSGRTVWSFDSSAFTDRLPLKIQTVILRKLKEVGYVTDMECQLLDLVSRGRWQTHDFETIAWKVGQPLGFGPSFNLATIAHYLIVKSLCDELDVKRYPFAIVGDDVAIANQQVAEMYHKVMTSLGVSINMDKSMISNLRAEFCGKLITENGPVCSVKTREIKHPDQLVSLLGFYGKKGMKHLNYHERIWAAKVVLPLEMGGLSMSPDGMTYKQYLNDLLDTEYIQKHSLLSQAKEFYSIRSDQSVESKLKFLSKFWEINVPDLSQGQALDMCLPYIHTSDWTGLPVSSGETPVINGSGSEAACSMNTYTYIFDTISRQILEKGKLPDLYPLWGSLGYISNGERKPARTIPTSLKEDTNDSIQHKRKTEFKGKPGGVKHRKYRELDHNWIADNCISTTNKTCGEEVQSQEDQDPHEVTGVNSGPKM